MRACFAYILSLISFCILPILPIHAATSEDLIEAAQLETLIEIMAEEGSAEARRSAQETMPRQQADALGAQIFALYQDKRHLRRLQEALGTQMSGDDRDLTLDFIQSAVGQKIIMAELSARKAMIAPEIEALSEEMAFDILMQKGPRFDVIRDLIAELDLENANVVSALNSNFAFLKGMASVTGQGMSDADLLARVWSEEPEIRERTQKWLYGFFGFAYRDLEDDDIRTYVAFAQTPEGQRFNAALFQGVGSMFETISFEMGRMLALRQEGQDI